MKSLLCEIAHSSVKTNSQFKGMYKGLLIRRGKKRAIVAVGHKILKIMFIILRDRRPYKDPDIDYEQLVVDRNAPRWLQALEKYGYIR